MVFRPNGCRRLLPVLPREQHDSAFPNSVARQILRHGWALLRFPRCNHRKIQKRTNCRRAHALPSRGQEVRQCHWLMFTRITTRFVCFLIRSRTVGDIQLSEIDELCLSLVRTLAHNSAEALSPAIFPFSPFNNLPYLLFFSQRQSGRWHRLRRIAGTQHEPPRARHIRATRQNLRIHPENANELYRAKRR